MKQLFTFFLIPGAGNILFSCQGLNHPFLTGPDEMVVCYQDITYGKYCDNQDCLMYWAAEHSGPVILFDREKILLLDQNCLNDLKNNGENEKQIKIKLSSWKKQSPQKTPKAKYSRHTTTC